MIVFGVLKRQGQVYTEIVPNAKVTCRVFIRGYVAPDAAIHSDRLVDIGFDKHYRAYHSENELARDKSA